MHTDLNRLLLIFLDISGYFPLVLNFPNIFNAAYVYVNCVFKVVWRSTLATFSSNRNSLLRQLRTTGWHSTRFLTLTPAWSKSELSLLSLRGAKTVFKGN